MNYVNENYGYPIRQEVLTLLESEMRSLKPERDSLSVTRSSDLLKKVKQLKEQCGGKTYLTFRQDYDKPGAAKVLGRFQVNYSGELTVRNGKWLFVGEMWFYDEWNFDPIKYKDNSDYVRGLGEWQVRFANIFAPGKPFIVMSQPVAVRQLWYENEVTW